MNECKECARIMGTKQPPHPQLIKQRERHTHPLFKCSECGSELVLLFDRWEPCFPGWLPAANG